MAMVQMDVLDRVTGKSMVPGRLGFVTRRDHAPPTSYSTSPATVVPRSMGAGDDEARIRSSSIKERREAKIKTLVA